MFSRRRWAKLWQERYGPNSRFMIFGFEKRKQALYPQLLETGRQRFAEGVQETQAMIRGAFSRKTIENTPKSRPLDKRQELAKRLK